MHPRPLALLVALALTPFVLADGKRAGPDFWSLRPLRQVEPPALDGIPNPVDRFVHAKLTEKGLKPLPEAEPRVLIRRLTFDLIGLPPTPEEVDAFLKDWAAMPQAAYERLVERLLKSPHFGEREARPWLDLVRYGESDGFERNEARPNSWHYRDWVIKAFNDDLPYDRFAKLQIAGDVIAPTDSEAVKATGFLVAGIHNTVVGSNPVMRLLARQDELEEIVSTVGQTFLGLTVQCARCHDHKFDPITMKDYYRLSAALGGVFHGERPLPTAQNPALAKIDALRSEIEKTESLARERALAKRKEDGGPLLPVMPAARWSFTQDAVDAVGELNGKLTKGAEIKNGRLVLATEGDYFASGPLPRAVREKTLEVWVSPATLDQRGGGILTIQTSDGGTFDAIVFAEQEPRRWMAGSDFFRRTRKAKGEPETAPPGAMVHVAIVYTLDGTVRMYRNGQQYGEAYRPDGQPLQAYKAGEAQVLMGLRHKGAVNGYFRGEIEEARLYDRPLTAEQVAASFKAGPDARGVSAEELAAELSAYDKERLAVLRKQLAVLETTRSKAPESTRTFAVLSRSVGPVHVLARGNVEKKTDLVTPGSVEAVPGVADFGQTTETPEGERRRRLADWVARPDNPLFSRVIVNRIWQQHFGVGLVDTPSDFGFNGGRPSHPELLDWLAGELVRQKYSLKAIHRIIVTSATYRQSSQFRIGDFGLGISNPKSPIRNPKLEDADNRLLWRKSPTRLEAEAFRDALLAVSGQLNTTAGGPGFLDTRQHGNAGTKFYEPIDSDAPDLQRRTIYRFSPRGERSAVLETLDCPDPSTQTPRRQVTTTALQALALWNNAMVLRLSEKFAERVAKEAAGVPDQVNRAYRLALARPPEAAEAARAEAFVRKHGLAALARVLFNSNEFVVIE